MGTNETVKDHAVAALRAALRAPDVAALRNLLDDANAREACSGAVVLHDGALVIAPTHPVLARRSARRRANQGLALACALGLLDGVVSLRLDPAPDALGPLAALPALRELLLVGGWRRASDVDAEQASGIAVNRIGVAKVLSPDVDLPPAQKRALRALRRAVASLRPRTLRGLAADPFVAGRLAGAVSLRGLALDVRLRHPEIARTDASGRRPTSEERQRRGLVIAAALGKLDGVEALRLDAWEPSLLRACVPALRTLVVAGGMHGEVAADRLPQRLTRIVLLEGVATPVRGWLEALLALPRLRQVVRVGVGLPLAPLVEAIAARRAVGPHARLPVVVWNDPSLQLGTPSAPGSVRRALHDVRHALADGGSLPEDALSGAALPLGHDARVVVLRGVRGLRDLGALSPLRDLRRLEVARCGALRTMAGLGGDHGAGRLREVRVTRCAALEDCGALALAASLREVALLGVPSLRDLSPLAAVEAVTLTRPPTRIGSGVRRLSLLSATARLGEVPLPRGLTHLTLRGFRGVSSVDDLRPLAALTDLRVLDLTGCEGLPGAERRVMRGAEIRVLLGVWTTPPAVARRKDALHELRKHPERLRALLPETREVLETVSAADVVRAETVLSEGSSPRSFEVEDAVACVSAFSAAMDDWRRCFARALAREGKVPLRDREDMLEMAVLDLWRQASAAGLAEWPLAHASNLASLRSSLLFHAAARERVVQWRRRLGTKGPLFYSNVVALPGKDGARATAQIHKEWETPHADAADVGVEDPEGGGARLLKRKSALWRGDLGVWTWTLPMMEAFRALAPVWLPRTTSRGGAKVPALSLRTLAALQSLPHTVSSRTRDYVEQTLGPPIADLDDEDLARSAWGLLRPGERGEAELLRQRALGVLQAALDDATGPTREAWAAAVSLERRTARGSVVTSSSDDARERAWLAVFEGKDVVNDVLRARSARRDSEGAAKVIWTSMGGDSLLRALLGLEDASGDAPSLTWEASDLRGLLAWSRAWARGGALGKGLRFRDAAALARAMEEAIAIEAQGGPDTLRNLVVLAAMAAQGDDAKDTRVAQLLARARARVASRSVAEVWSAVRGPSRVPSPPARNTPDERLLAASLDAVELLVAAAWLGVDGRDEVVTALKPRVAAASVSGQVRAKRALELLATRFPGARAQVDALVGHLAAPSSSAPMPPMVAVALGQPILTEPSSTAYAEDGDPSRLRALGGSGPAADAWLDGDRLVLLGAGWEVDGLALDRIDAESRVERQEVTLPAGRWLLRRQDRVVARIVVRG